MPAAARRASSAASHAPLVPPGPPGPHGLLRGVLHRRVDDHDRGVEVGGQRIGLGGLEPVDTDDDVFTALHPPAPLGQRADHRALHVPGLDRRDGAAELLDARHLGRGALDQLGDLLLDDDRAGEEVLVLEEVGLVGQHLLQPQRPLLVPGARQAERLVPGRQLHRPGAGVAGERDPEHLEHDPLDVVLRLRLGQAQGVHLDAVAEPALLGVLDAVALARQLVPELAEGAHLAHLLDEADPRVDEEGHAGHDLAEALLRHLPGGTHGVQHGDRGADRVRDLLHRRGPGLLQVVAADVDRVPPGHRRHRVGDHVGDQPHRRRRREDVGPPRQVLLDDVVLRGPGELRDVVPVLLGHRLVEREQPHRGGVDRHRRVHLVERDAVEERAHVADVGDRDADLADLTDGELVVGVVAGLRGQVEGHRQAGLALGQVAPVQGVGLGR